MLYYDYPEGKRTSNSIDRLMKYQERREYCAQHFHGNINSAGFLARAYVLLYNFAPYSLETIIKKKGIASPFEEVNGFKYRENWLENLLVAGSLGGNRPHK